jgi:hypothetical protein
LQFEIIICYAIFEQLSVKGEFMNQDIMKKFVIMALLLCSFPVFTTMGDNAAVEGKKINFYGKLETYTLQTKRVEQISFWNRQLKAQLLQAPISVIDMIKTEKPKDASKGEKTNKEEEFLLSENPAIQGIVATVELREIESLSVPLQKRIVYKKNDKIIQEFMVIEIKLHGGDGMYYLTEKSDKFYCNEQSGKEVVELEVPLASIKTLTIEGFITADQSSS